MIRLYLQMFGRGSSGGVGAGGGGTNGAGKSKTVTKQEVSNNAPSSSHGSAGGRKTDTSGTNRVVNDQAKAPSQNKEYITNTTLKERELYDVYRISHGKEQIDTEAVVGFRVNQYMMYNAREGFWRDRHGNKFRVKRSVRK